MATRPDPQDDQRTAESLHWGERFSQDKRRDNDGEKRDEELETRIKEIIEQLGATSMKDMGQVMGAANKAFAGKADGKTISAKVKALLNS